MSLFLGTDKYKIYTSSIDSPDTFIRYNIKSIYPDNIFDGNGNIIWHNPNIYIQSAGTQYIDTGVYPDDTTVVQARFIYSTSNGGTLIGRRVTNAQETISENDNFRFFKYSSTTYLDYGSGLGYNRISCSFVTSSTTIYEVEFGNRYIKNLLTDTNVISSSTVSFTEKSYTICIFGANDYGKMYYVKIYKGGELVRDLIPFTNSSDVIGMQDLVNNVFYSNAGTGTFIYGKDE